jgi:hypothetical protein
LVPKALFWQIPLIVVVCIAGSLAAVWVVSQAMGFSMNASVVAVLSAVLSAAAIALDLRRTRQA